MAFVGFVIFLLIEKYRLKKWHEANPLRITISGIRGKSSVVRMLASVLRENGSKVLAKTTGSEAKYILPNGDENDVTRRGVVSIIEQKKLVRKAAALGVDCLVAEAMSIHPENHFVESQRILKPTIVGITNVRPDHVDALGQSSEEIASVLSLDIADKATVFVPENECWPEFEKAAANKGGKLVKVQPGESAGLEIATRQFPESIDLVYAIAKYLKVNDNTIRRGIEKTTHDIGQLKIWKFALNGDEKYIYFVNGFAANDPESTAQVLNVVKEMLPGSKEKIMGLLSLRTDRADRSVQWLRELQQSDFGFRRLYLIGPHANVVKRKINGAEIINEKIPHQISEKLIAENETGSVIFGFGNYKGTGRALVDYWNQAGEDYGL